MSALHTMYVCCFFVRCSDGCDHFADDIGSFEATDKLYQTLCDEFPHKEFEFLAEIDA